MGKGRRGMLRPSHLPRRTWRGWRTCAASGKLILADDFVDDVRQGPVRPDFADITPGFGTYHPLDEYDPGDLSDPTPIENAYPGSRSIATKEELGISDAEVRLSIQEGRTPRRGY